VHALAIFISLDLGNHRYFFLNADSRPQCSSPSREHALAT
jgi:hypothetical protein